MVHSEQVFVTSLFFNLAFTNSNFGASVGWANNGSPYPPIVCDGMEPIAEAATEETMAAPAESRYKEGMFSRIR